MKVVLSTEVNQVFDQVKVGQVFKYSGDLYLRIAEVQSKFDGTFNVAQLTNGQLGFIYHWNVVTEVDHYQVTPITTSKSKAK